MNVPANLKYTKSHEWIRSEADGTITTRRPGSWPSEIVDTPSISFTVS